MSKLKKRSIIFGSLVILFIITMYVTYPLRVVLAGTILTTQHRQYVWITLLPSSKINALREAAMHPTVINSAPVNVIPVVAKETPQPIIPEKLNKPLVELVQIQKDFSPAHYFKGYLVKVNDPSKIRLVPATIHNGGTSRERGEWLEEIVKSNNAVAALNASGFSDPDQMSWASHPMGLVIIDGKLIQDYDTKSSDTALAITYDGKLVTGNYTSEELLAMGVRSAVSFKPQLVVNGQSLFSQNEDAWGYQPRSAVGQTADGTILLMQIDGRRKASIGASMKDMADLMLEYGAVNAMAMDGGTSAFLSFDGETKTVSPVSDERGGFLPNAWIVTK